MGTSENQRVSFIEKIVQRVKKGVQIIRGGSSAKAIFADRERLDEIKRGNGTQGRDGKGRATQEREKRRGVRKKEGEACFSEKKADEWSSAYVNIKNGWRNGAGKRISESGMGDMGRVKWGEKENENRGE